MNIEKLSKYDLLEGARLESETFASFTAKITKEEFDTKGIEALQEVGSGTVDDFIRLTLRFVLNEVRTPEINDNLALQGFGAEYSNMFGEYQQRMYIKPTKPISPKFKDVAKYGSPNPFTFRPNEIDERFYRQNFNYQNLLSIKDDELRKALLSQDELSRIIAGFMKNLENAYVLQKYLTKIEVINKMINSSTIRTDTQIHEQDVSSADGLKAFILTLKNLVSYFKTNPISTKYNSMKFASAQNSENLVLLIRPNLKNDISVKVLSSAFNKGEFDLDVKMIEVENFGGIIRTDGAGGPLKPVYDEMGVEIGFNYSGSIEDPLIPEELCKDVDNNSDVYAILCDKKILFSNKQLPYEIESIRNPAGRYTNYWASQPNGTIAWDNSYNMIIFKTPAETKTQAQSPAQNKK